jgi:hypothetical protein
MRSRRSLLETGCRLAAFALLGWLIGMALTPGVGRRTERATASTLGSALPAWTRSGGHVALHADLDVVPSRATIDWLAALARAGRPVSWSGSPPLVAIGTEPIADPTGGTRIDVVAPRGARVGLSDDVSTIDSLRVGALGASVTTPVLVGAPTARAGNQPLIAGAPDSLRLGSVVVVGRASWEGKFVVAALEERGWRVTGRWTVAPSVDVAQGSVVFDTSEVSAVVALDSSAASLAGAIERFVRSGGGLVIAGSAGLAPNFASLAPAASAQRIAPRAVASDTLDRASAGFYALTSLRGDAIPLERRENRIAVAARRVQAGRVIQVGFDESWRWRMAGAPGAEASHRAWWSQIIGSVAYAPSHPEPFASLEGRLREGSAFSRPLSAPVAMLVDRLGPARAAAPANIQRWSPDNRILLTIMLACLLIEWVSRRLRGAR